MLRGCRVQGFGVQGSGLRSGFKAFSMFNVRLCEAGRPVRDTGICGVYEFGEPFVAVGWVRLVRDYVSAGS